MVSSMPVIPKIALVFAAAAAVSALAASPALAQEDFSGHWSSSTFGALRLHQDFERLEGRYDFKEGRVRGRVDGREAHGTWVQDSSARRCFDERMGTHYWGRFEWRLSHDGDRFHGRWGYCNEMPDQEWNAER